MTGPAGPVALTYVEGEPVIVSPGATGSAQAACPADKHVVGGGLAHLSYRSGSNDVRSLESRSFDDAGDADWVPDDLWVVSVHNSETIQYVIRSYAVCASATTIALG